MVINLLTSENNWKDYFCNGFATRRLQIRPMQPDDFTRVIPELYDPEMFIFLKNLNDQNDLEQWLRRVYNKRRYLFFVIGSISVDTKKECEPIGVLVLNQHPAETIEIGGWISGRFQGDGYASDIVRGLVLFVKRMRIPVTLVADVDASNMAVKKVMSCSGFSETRTEGTTTRFAYYYKPVPV